MLGRGAPKWGFIALAAGFSKHQRLPINVDVAYYDGTADSRRTLIEKITKLRGIAFPASELQFRHDMGTYYHSEYGFVYVPQGQRSAGSSIMGLRDDELVVKTDTGIYAVVFPGDYIVRSRSGFYPITSESYDRGYQPNARRRGTTIPAGSPSS